MVIVRFRDYLIGNNGLVIPSIIYVYLGASAERIFKLLTASKTTEGEGTSEVKEVEAILMVVGGIILTVLICSMGYLTKKELDRMLREEQEGRRINREDNQGETERQDNAES